MCEWSKRACFQLCRALGQVLRGSRYSHVRIEQNSGRIEIRKWRRFYAPALISMGRVLVRMLNTGQRVLAEREWVERETLLYSHLYSSAVTLEAGVLVLPYLSGETLAALLERGELSAFDRQLAIELAVAALNDFHAEGFTHGDAMAENVLIDLVERRGHWFDFETVHNADQAISWCRADDYRALIATILLRTRAKDIPETLRFILAICGDEEAMGLLPSFFRSDCRRSLVFHLGQAPLGYQTFSEIGRLLARSETWVSPPAGPQAQH